MNFQLLPCFFVLPSGGFPYLRMSPVHAWLRTGPLAAHTSGGNNRPPRRTPFWKKFRNSLKNRPLRLWPSDLDALGIFFTELDPQTLIFYTLRQPLITPGSRP